MLFIVYLRLFLCGLVAVAVSVLFYLLLRFTKFRNLKPMVIQIIIGVAFGAVAIFGTEVGVPVGGATANARDAAPLCAGLLFGGPAGIIAGAIGGIERVLSTYVFHRAGEYSVVACSISTLIAGIYAALLRKFMFDNKRPTWPFALAIGVVMETIHLTILLVTKMDNTAQAILILKDLCIPMIAATSVSLTLSVIVLKILSSQKDKREKKYFKIAHKVQLWLLGVVLVAFTATTIFVNVTQTNSALINGESLLKESIEDVSETVLKFSDESLEEIAKQVKETYEGGEDDMTVLHNMYKNSVTEINIVDETGQIIASNVEEYVINNFNMATAGGQASEFHEIMMDENTTFYSQKFLPQSNDESIMMKYAGIKLANGKGYIQVGLNAESFKGTLNESFYEITVGRHVDKTGYIVILDSDSKIISDLPEIQENIISEAVKVTDPSLLGIDVTALNELAKMTRLEGDLFGQKVHFMYAEAETYYIITAIPEFEINETRDAQLYINSFMEILVYAALFALIYFLIKILVVNNIQKINNKLGTIIDGDLSVKVDVTASEEFASLSNDINYTVDTLKRFIDEAAARIDKELAFAKTIQISSLPSVWPAYPNEKGFDIYATMNTAKEVGGDFYDLYMIDLDHLGFLIADVSGKGIPAAMFMMESKTMLKNFAKSGCTIDEILTKANENLCQGNEAGMFVTCWFGILDKRTGVVEFANAGHNNPVIYRKGKGWEMIAQKKNLVLGGLDGIKYVKQEFKLEPGDRLYLYTDGVTEATRGDGALYGDDRLINFLNKNMETPDKELLEGIKGNIDEFVEGADQFDDITMLVLDYKGEEN